MKKGLYIVSLIVVTFSAACKEDCKVVAPGISGVLQISNNKYQTQVWKYDSVAYEFADIKIKTPPASVFAEVSGLRSADSLHIGAVVLYVNRSAHSSIKSVQILQSDNVLLAGIYRQKQGVLTSLFYKHENGDWHLVPVVQSKAVNANALFDVYRKYLSANDTVSVLCIINKSILYPEEKIMQANNE